MQRPYFLDLEELPSSTEVDLEEVIKNLPFNEQGLLPVITQDYETKEVLMFAWINHEALIKTLETKKMTYYSRSRKNLWIKGETSGHTQQLVQLSFDCDGDAVLCQVIQEGAACHTGRKNCFYLHADWSSKTVTID